MFNTFLSFLNVDFSSFFNTLNLEGATFSDFLNLLKSVVLMFLEYFVKFCNVLIDNWFILVIVGFGLFVSVIWIAFDFMDISLFGLGIAKENIDDYLDKKADEKNAIRQLAEKELIMRQNAQYEFDKKSLELARKELVMIQNRTQVFDPDSNAIVNVADSSFVENLRFRNYKNYNYGIVTGFILKRSNTPDLPSWFGKIIEPVPATVEEQEQMKKDLEVISND